MNKHCVFQINKGDWLRIAIMLLLFAVVIAGTVTDHEPLTFQMEFDTIARLGIDIHEVDTSFPDHVFFAGQIPNINLGTDPVLMKVSKSGSVLWKNAIRSRSSGSVFIDKVLASKNGMFSIGHTQDKLKREYFLLEIDGDGELVNVHQIRTDEGTLPTNAFVSQMYINEQNEIVSMFQNSTSKAMLVLSFEGDALKEQLIILESVTNPFLLSFVKTSTDSYTILAICENELTRMHYDARAEPKLELSSYQSEEDHIFSSNNTISAVDMKNGYNSVWVAVASSSGEFHVFNANMRVEELPTISKVFKLEHTLGKIQNLSIRHQGDDSCLVEGINDEGERLAVKILIDDTNNPKVTSYTKQAVAISSIRVVENDLAAILTEEDEDKI